MYKNKESIHWLLHSTPAKPYNIFFLLSLTDFLPALISTILKKYTGIYMVLSLLYLCGACPRFSWRIFHCSSPWWVSWSQFCLSGLWIGIVEGRFVIDILAWRLLKRPPFLSAYAFSSDLTRSMYTLHIITISM